MIQIEPTPNPDSLKFLSEKTISSIGTEEFRAKDKDKVHIIEYLYEEGFILDPRTPIRILDLEA